MKKLELFQCEFCGSRYSIETDCQKCEDNHIKPEKISSKNYLQGYMSKNYPHMINVLMEDGHKIAYIKQY